MNAIAILLLAAMHELPPVVEVVSQTAGPYRFKNDGTAGAYVEVTVRVNRVEEGHVVDLDAVPTHSHWDGWRIVGCDATKGGKATPTWVSADAARLSTFPLTLPDLKSGSVVKLRFRLRPKHSSAGDPSKVRLNVSPEKEKTGP